MEKIRSVIVCGMGGSSLPGHALNSWSLVTRAPFEITIWNSYDLPRAISKSALVFCVSHSGNTEETLTSFHAARRAGHKIFAVTTGGKLAALARKFRVPVLEIASSVPPRMAIAEMTFAILHKLHQLGMTKISAADKRAFADFNPIAMKKPGALERRIAKSVPLVYTPREWYAVGHIWKIVLNETAKIPAFSYTLPEANHNEMEGFTEAPTAANQDFYALFLDFKNSHPRTRQRIILSQKAWQRAGIRATRIIMPAGGFWKTFFETLEQGYAISRVIAEIRGVDPSATHAIEEFKKQMARARS